MHPSSVKNMQQAKEYVRYIYDLKHLSVIDVGGLYDMPHKTYLRLFEDHPSISWTVADIVKHPSVDVVMPGPYNLPFPNETFDLVVSGQMLEHCSNPFKSITEMRRVLKTGSSMIIIAPSSGPRHDVQDCWRFMDDAFKAIVDDIGGIKIIANWIDKSAEDERSRKWQDHVFVGRKT